MLGSGRSRNNPHVDFGVQPVPGVSECSSGAATLIPSAFYQKTLSKKVYNFPSSQLQQFQIYTRTEALQYSIFLTFLLSLINAAYEIQRI
jgi:hypothetical protein